MPPQTVEISGRKRNMYKNTGDIMLTSVMHEQTLTGNTKTNICNVFINNLMKLVLSKYI